MKQRKSALYRISIFLFFIFLIILSALCYYNYSRRPNPNELYIISANSYSSERPVTIFFFACDAAETRAIKHKDISLFIDDKPIPTKETKSDGIAVLTLKKYPRCGFTIKACLGEISVEKFIKIRSPFLSHGPEYDSHKPKIELYTDKPFYAPGDIIKVKAEGANALEELMIKTMLTIAVPDNSMFGGCGYSFKEKPYRKIKITADSKGKFNFQLKLPVAFGEIDFSKDDSVCEFSLEEILPPDKFGIFKNNMKSEFLKKVVISSRPLRAKCLPEFNDFIYKGNNNLYVFVSDPANNPLSAVVKSKTESIETDENGLALVKLPWESYQKKTFSLDVECQGKALRKIELPEFDFREPVIRTDKLIYNSGEKIRLNLYPYDESFIINAAKNGVSWKLFQRNANSRKQYIEFQLPENMSGLIEVSAYVNKVWMHRKIYTRIVQFGDKSCFRSEGEMIKARFKAPLNSDYEAALESAKNNTDITASSKYYERKEGLRKEKKAFGRMLFFSLLAGLFLTLVLLFWNFMRTCFDKTCFLLVLDKTRKKVRDNIFISALGYCLLTFVLWKFLDIIKSEKVKMTQITTFSYSSIIIAVVYILVLGIILWRLFFVSNVVLKESEDVDENKVKKSVFLLPYLFAVFVFFQHSYLVGLMFHNKMNALILLFWFFQMLAVVWFFYVYGIMDFLYTKEEYELMYGGQKMLGSGLGIGIGAYRNSFYRTWILGGSIYWGVPVVMYSFIFIIILSMFLPLIKMCSYFFRWFWY